jgi:GDP-L-fucose synthase
MPKINLTGHKGLVGSAIKAEIPTIDYTKRINNLEDYSNFLTENQIDTIIHTAAKVGGVVSNYNNKIDFYLLNSNLNNIVFEAALKTNVKKLINFSSTCVFPDKVEYPLKEEYIFEGPPHYTNDSYAYAKRMMQHLCIEAKKLGHNYFTIVPTNVFGLNDYYNLQNSHVLPGMIHKCFLAKQNNTEFVIWGSGKPLREFIYSKDLARITKQLTNIDHDYDSVIVSNGNEISIEECAYTIAKAFGFKGNIVYDSSKPDGQFRKPTDISRLKELIPDLTFTPFEDAINESIEWFVTNYEQIRK